MNNCYTGTNVPELQTEQCNGNYVSDNCITHPQSITYLSLPENSSVNTIVSNLILALQYKDEQISALSARITILENV